MKHTYRRLVRWNADQKVIKHPYYEAGCSCRWTSGEWSFDDDQTHYEWRVHVAQARLAEHTGVKP